MIEGGYILQPRQFYKSMAAKFPPHVREIWFYLLQKANYFPDGNMKISRGECLITYKQIQEDLSWFVGYRKETYKKHHCEIAMKLLRKHHMITTAKTTRGIRVTICNYNYYQNADNYESYNETTMKLQCTDTICKNRRIEE